MLQESGGLDNSSSIQQLEDLVVACVQQVSLLGLDKCSPATAPLWQHLRTLLHLQRDIHQARLAAQAHSATLANGRTADASECIANLENLLRLQAYGDRSRCHKQAMEECQHQLADVLGYDTAAALAATFKTLYATWVQKLKDPVQVISKQCCPVLAPDQYPLNTVSSKHCLTSGKHLIYCSYAEALQ